MANRISGLEIRGRVFSETRKMVLFRDPSHRVALVYGANASGKTTTARGIRAAMEVRCGARDLTQEPPSGVLRAQFIGTDGRPVCISEERSATVVSVFDDEYIHRAVKFKSSALETIVLFDEQIEAEADLATLKDEVEGFERARDEAQTQHETRRSAREATLERIKTALREGWAVRERDILGNRSASRVTDSILRRIKEYQPSCLPDAASLGREREALIDAIEASAERRMPQSSIRQCASLGSIGWHGMKHSSSGTGLFHPERPMKRPGFVGGSRVTDGEWSHGPTQEQRTPLLG